MDLNYYSSPRFSQTAEMSCIMSWKPWKNMDILFFWSAHVPINNAQFYHEKANTTNYLAISYSWWWWYCSCPFFHYLSLTQENCLPTCLQTCHLHTLCHQKTRPCFKPSRNRVDRLLYKYLIESLNHKLSLNYNRSYLLKFSLPYQHQHHTHTHKFNLLLDWIINTFIV